MTTLAGMTCEACEVGAPTVTREEEAELHRQVPDWEISEVDGERRLQRVFTFKSWKRPMALANSISELAEAQGHHPALLVEWGKLTVTWWTHKIGGLHQNDFVMAAKTDQAAEQ